MKLPYLNSAVMARAAGCAALLCCLSLSSAEAQLITSDAVWDFTTASPVVTPANANVIISDISQGNNNGTTALLSNTSPSSGYTGASGGNNAGAAARVGSLNTGASGSAYFEVTFTPVAAVIVNSLSFGSRSTGTGPQAYSVRTSIDGYASNAAAGTLTANSTWSLNTTALSGVGFNGPVTLRIYGHNGAGSPGANTANWRIDDVTFNVSASAVPLPVSLARLEAVKQARNILLRWTTASEKNTARFDIEKSADGVSFLHIGTVPARNLASGATYTYEDDDMQSAAQYYRLRMTDFDGQYAYSPVVSVTGTGYSSVVLRANPVDNVLSLALSGSSTAQLRILNMTGQVLQQRKVSNESQVVMDVSVLQPGMYLLQVSDAGSRQTFRFIKR